MYLIEPYNPYSPIKKSVRQIIEEDELFIRMVVESLNQNNNNSTAQCIASSGASAAGGNVLLDINGNPVLDINGNPIITF